MLNRKMSHTASSERFYEVANSSACLNESNLSMRWDCRLRDSLGEGRLAYCGSITRHY